MLIVSGLMKFRPDRIADARREALVIMEASKAEAGCRTYELSAQVADPLTFRLFEEWESAEALTLHFQTSHFKAFAALLPGLLAAAPSFLRYEVARVAPLR